MVLGCNQGDMVSIKPFARDRVLGYRWPLDIPLPHLELPAVRDGRLSQNEA